MSNLNDDLFFGFDNSGFDETNSLFYYNDILFKEPPTINNEDLNYVENNNSIGQNGAIEKGETKNKLPEFCAVDLIKEKLNKNIRDEKIKKLLNQVETIKNLKNYYFILKGNKKGIREYLESEKNNYLIKTNLTTEGNENAPNEANEAKILNKKRGKEKVKNLSIPTHDKMSSDNIIKKIKAYLFNYYILNFLNIILNLKEKKLGKLNYEKYINKLIKEKDLEYLKMTLKDLYSLHTSIKYGESNLNKSIIDESINKGDKTINFVLNLTYSDFIELFTYKKTLEDMIKLNDIQAEIDYEKIKNCLPGVEELFTDLLKEKKYDVQYATMVVFYLYNLERALQLKQDRIKK